MVEMCPVLYFPFFSKTSDECLEFATYFIFFRRTIKQRFNIISVMFSSAWLHCPFSYFLSSFWQGLSVFSRNFLFSLFIISWGHLNITLNTCLCHRSPLESSSRKGNFISEVILVHRIKDCSSIALASLLMHTSISGLRTLVSILQTV